MIRPIFSFAIGAIVAISIAFSGNRHGLRADDNGGSQFGNGGAQLAPDKFELRAAGTGENAWAGIRFNRRTGDSWSVDYVLTSKSSQRKFTKIIDEKEIPPGDYDVQLVDVHNAVTPMFLRIEHSSGKCWEAWEGKWRPVKEDVK